MDEQNIVIDDDIDTGAKKEEISPIEKPPMKKVLIACPTVGIDPNPNQWLMGFIQTMDEFKTLGFQVSIFLPYKVGLDKVDEMIFLSAIVGQYDYLFRMDDDIWNVPPGSIKKLVDADKDFISGVMPVNDFPFSLCAFQKHDKTKSLIDTWKEKSFDFNEVTYSKDPIVPIDLTAMPYTLFKVGSLFKLKAPFFGGHPGAPNDSVFCQKCLDVGIQPYVHMDVQLCHRNVTPWNRWYLWNAEARQRLANGSIPKDSNMYKKLAEIFGEDGTKNIDKLLGTDPGQVFSAINPGKEEKQKIMSEIIDKVNRDKKKKKRANDANLPNKDEAGKTS